MKKVILNQISKALDGGNNYFYLPVHLVESKTSNYYGTTADLSKLFELDSNNVPVVKEIVVYDNDTDSNINFLYSTTKHYDHYYTHDDNKLTIKDIVQINGISVISFKSNNETEAK